MINAVLDSKVYSKNAIIKCLYWYSSNFEISVELDEKGYYNITLKPKSDLPEEEIESIRKKLNQDFQDYNLRDVVAQETKTIRELLIAKAFSHGEFDEDPPGMMEDPLGIKFLE